MEPFLSPECVSVFVVHKIDNTARYLLIHRCGKYLPNTWQMVTGGIHEGETAWQTALRELKEETGLVPDSLYSADAIESFYLLHKDKITFVPVFVAYVSGDLEITLSPNEHDKFEWLSAEEASKRLVWAEQRRILDHVHREFVLKEPHPLLKIFQ